MTDIEEYGAFVERILRATERRVSNGDIEGLRVLARLRTIIDTTTTESIIRLRSEPWEYSWADIGGALGVTRQAAQQWAARRSIDRNEEAPSDRGSD